MIPCVFQSIVEMVDDETARYLMEQIIAGDGSGDNLPISYTDEEGTQVDMFLNMSGNGNEEPEPQQNLVVVEGSSDGNEELEPQQNLTVVEGSSEVYIIFIVLPHL